MYVVTSAAPSHAGPVSDLVVMAQAAGWRVYVISTPLGVRFLDPSQIQELTGEPISSDFRMPDSDQARDMALRAAETLRTRSHKLGPSSLSVWGGLQLVAATAASHIFDRATSDGCLAHAQRAANHLGHERNDFWNAFGTTNIQIHRLSAAVAVGDARPALEIGESLDVSRMPDSLVGRRTQVHLDLAHAYTVQRKDAAAVHMLLHAERQSPEPVRYDQRTHDVLTQLIKREHRPSTPQLRGLAQRAGVV
ncbi:hypothetical protein [Nonomuraea sp. NPDC049158]|uniref:hypothetical protein n=1 Tax=Nonomuraea sp. NPDC049158 TaxID=3155649 RepID=UPI0033F031E8